MCIIFYISFVTKYLVTDLLGKIFLCPGDNHITTNSATLCGWSRELII
jgi:hypothetical protein